MSSSNIAIQLKDLEEKVNSIFENYINVTSNKINNGGIPESVYNLVEEIHKVLLEIKNLVGVENEIYDSLSTKLVLFSSGVISDWTINMKQYIAIPVSGMRLGNNFLEVCDVVFKKIDSVEVNPTVKKNLSEKRYNYEVLKLNLTIHNKPKSGCFIATAAYNDYNHPNVLFLQKFRDSYLSRKKWGMKFIYHYYKHSPRFAKKISNSVFLKRIVSIFFITPVILTIKLYSLINKIKY